MLIFESFLGTICTYIAMNRLTLQLLKRRRKNSKRIWIKNFLKKISFWKKFKKKNSKKMLKKKYSASIAMDINLRQSLLFIILIQSPVWSLFMVGVGGEGSGPLSNPPLSPGSPNKLKWPPRPRSNSAWHLSGWWQHSWQGTILRDRDTQTVTLWQWPHLGSVYNLYCHRDYYPVTRYYWVRSLVISNWQR